MSDATALLAAIRAAPEDDAPRLVYADWLEEHGQPERAEFIRVQCELARRDSLALRQREAELTARYCEVFAGSLASPGIRFQFHRGFIAGFGHTGLFMYLGGSSWANSLFRFFPDGLVLSATTSELPESISTYFRRDCRFNSRGQYSLDALGYPAGLRFSCNSAEGDVDFRGVLECASILVDAHSRITGRHSRQRYSHTHVGGFDSFTET